jgi:ABC-type uncharacterized transport system substrate-binding protein
MIQLSTFAANYLNINRMKNSLYLLFLILLLSGCAPQQKAQVLYINSYHEGYPLSDEVMKTTKEELEGKNIEMESFFLNSKLYPEEESIVVRAKQAAEITKLYQPDIIILSDDNAVKYFGSVYKDSLNIPFVFCGVNWDDAVYNLPKDQFTGILEILHVKESIDYLKQSWPDAKKLGILSENTNSERKNQVYLNRMTGMKNEFRLVNDFEEWKQKFLELSESCDMIFLPTNGAIKNWNDEEAENFVKNHIKIPVFTCDDFMMRFSAFGMTKVAGEQGEWAANMAWMIINGKDVSDIPVVKNQKFVSWVNPEIASLINFNPKDLKDIKYYPKDYKPALKK